ncbi:MAG: antibiotic biosynthesis monooxygenase [Stenomitos rutilans HA7619-LM2]|jgi:quinol monooxygenase YgiN|nr:antibiotic biosynthesis monooxygenase [Stenomitos rutilans HA7619-LM2]
MTKIGVFLRFVARDGKKEALLKHLLETAEIAGKEPGTKLWTVHSSPIEPNTVWVYEAYADEQSKKRHESTPEYASAREDTGRLLAHPPQAFPLIPVGGKGL